MKTRILLILLLMTPMVLLAEHIHLKNGKTVSGTILVQDADIVIIRNASGARFQFPTSDILSIEKDEEVASDLAQKSDANRNESGKKTIIRLELAGGMGTVPHESYGGAASGSLLVGSKQIAGREITLGGLVGYQGFFLPATSPTEKGTTYHFLPIAAALRIPILSGAHSPELGGSIGYGVALSKSYKGGVYVGADIGYRYLTPSDKRIYAGVYTHFQQATMPGTEYVADMDASYSSMVKCALVTAGVKLAFSL